MPSTVEEARVLLRDATLPIDVRIQALYTVKSDGKLLENAQAIIDAVDTTDSVLLQHELLYNLGQFQIIEVVVDFLKHVVTARNDDNGALCDVSCPEATGEMKCHRNNNNNIINRDSFKYNVISRHEAVESLGAIFAAKVYKKQEGTQYTNEEAGVLREGIIAFLKKLTDDKLEPFVEIRESAILAVQRAMEGGYILPSTEFAALSQQHSFLSVDPTPAFPSECDDTTLASYKQYGENSEVVVNRINELEKILNSTDEALWDRYRAMFSLRNIGTDGAVSVLCRCLLSDNSSALFRHEVAFVLGQLESSISVDTLAKCLGNIREHPMVRHEAAEAIGGIALDAGMAVLERYCNDDEGVVKDSCIVAIDMHRYWSKFK